MPYAFTSPHELNMRKKQPTKQAYARHVLGQSGSSSTAWVVVGWEACRIDSVSVAAFANGRVLILPSRLSFSNKRGIVLVGCSFMGFRGMEGTNLKQMVGNFLGVAGELGAQRIVLIMRPINVVP